MERSTYMGDLGSGLFDTKQNWNFGLQFGMEWDYSQSYSLGFFHHRGRLSYRQDVLEYEQPSFSSRYTSSRLQGNYHLNNGLLLPLDSDLRWSVPHFVGLNRYTSDQLSESHVSLGAGVQVSYRLDADWTLVYTLLHHWAMTPDIEVKGYRGSDSQDKFLTHGLGVNYRLAFANDTDGDGIIDSRDLCPESIGTIEMGGCPDSDFDGVSDLHDACVYSPGPMETRGCPDTDKDGCIDDEDECPNLRGPKETEGCPDTDGDGVIDCNDECPEVKGPIALFGCPDTDGDGVPDGRDACPELHGLVEYRGCPDTDRDGVPDGEDRCPSVSGSISSLGCPDSDEDGLIDIEDDCPHAAGTIENRGCPQSKYFRVAYLDSLAVKIKFSGLSSQLRPSSHKSLNKVVDFMQDQQQYKLRVVGHLASNQDEELNMIYSLERAGAVKKYLIDNGLEEGRVSAIGLGETEAENSSGISLRNMFWNRRIELRVAPSN